MDGYITFSQLGLLVIFLVVVMAGGYSIITLKNVNKAVKDIGLILKENQVVLNQAVSNIAAASGNMVAITSDLRTGLGETGRVIETADQIATYALVIGETAKTLFNLFSSLRND